MEPATIELLRKVRSGVVMAAVAGLVILLVRAASDVPPEHVSERQLERVMGQLNEADWKQLDRSLNVFARLRQAVEARNFPEVSRLSREALAVLGENRAEDMHRINVDWPAQIKLFEKALLNLAEASDRRDQAAFDKALVQIEAYNSWCERNAPKVVIEAATKRMRAK